MDGLAVWRQKLASWKYAPDHPYRELVAKELAKVLADKPPETREELVVLYAAAFGLEAEQAWKDVEYIPEARTAAHVLPPVPRYGVVGRYMDWLREQESPPQYHAFSLLTIFSAAIARRTYFMLGPYPVFPNMYTILVGESGSRKDSAIDVALTVVANGTDALNILPVEGSAQGMAAALEERAAGWGISDGLILVDEMKVLFGGKRDSYRSEIPVWLTDWFKCPDTWERGLATRKVVLNNVYIVLLAGTTEDWLFEMPPSVLQGGFFPRCLLVWAQGKKHWKWAPGVDKGEGRTLAQVVAEALLDIPPEMVMAPGADKYMQEWYETKLPQWSREAPMWTKTYLERAHVHAVKLAQVVNLLEGRGATITRETVEFAAGLVEWVVESGGEVLRRVSTTESTRIYDDIVNCLAKHGGVMTEQEVCRALRNKYRSKEVRSALAALKFHGELRAGLKEGKSAVSLG